MSVVADYVPDKKQPSVREMLVEKFKPQVTVIVAMSANLPSSEFTVKELTQLMSLLTEMWMFGAEDPKLAEELNILEARVFEVQKKLGLIEEVDPRTQD